jgi:hypothetical protein
MSQWTNQTSKIGGMYVYIPGIYYTSTSGGAIVNSIKRIYYDGTYVIGIINISVGGNERFYCLRATPGSNISCVASDPLSTQRTNLSSAYYDNGVVHLNYVSDLNYRYDWTVATNTMSAHISGYNTNGIAIGTENTVSVDSQNWSVAGATFSSLTVIPSFYIGAG